MVFLHFRAWSIMSPCGSKEKMVRLLHLTQMSVLSPGKHDHLKIVPIIATIFDPGLNSPEYGSCSHSISHSPKLPLVFL